MPVAVFDVASIHGSITVRFATGGESFTDLGSTESVSPEPGEVIFVDRNGIVSARRWCWRQSAHSATTGATIEALFVIEGHHDNASQEIEAALPDLSSVIGSYQADSQTRTYELSSTANKAEEGRSIR